MKNNLFLAAIILFISGCSTATYIKLPENSVLKIKRGDEPTYTEGFLERSPLSWSSAGGIPYEIEQDGAIIQEGRMRARFRVSSIFWPPFGIFYWPMGFGEKCNDFTGDAVTRCSRQIHRELRSEYRKQRQQERLAD